jgi:hypothetical protein
VSDKALPFSVIFGVVSASRALLVCSGRERSPGILSDEFKDNSELVLLILVSPQKPYLSFIRCTDSLRGAVMLFLSLGGFYFWELGFDSKGNGTVKTFTRRGDSRMAFFNSACFFGSEL